MEKSDDFFTSIDSENVQNYGFPVVMRETSKLVMRDTPTIHLNSTMKSPSSTFVGLYSASSNLEANLKMEKSLWSLVEVFFGDKNPNSYFAHTGVYLKHLYEQIGVFYLNHSSNRKETSHVNMSIPLEAGDFHSIFIKTRNQFSPKANLYTCLTKWLESDALDDVASSELLLESPSLNSNLLSRVASKKLWPNTSTLLESRLHSENQISSMEFDAVFHGQASKSSKESQLAFPLKAAPAIQDSSSDLASIRRTWALVRSGEASRALSEQARSGNPWRGAVLAQALEFKDPGIDPESNETCGRTLSLKEKMRARRLFLDTLARASSGLLSHQPDSVSLSSTKQSPALREQQLAIELEKALFSTLSGTPLAPASSTFTWSDLAWMHAKALLIKTDFEEEGVEFSFPPVSEFLDSVNVSFQQHVSGEINFDASSSPFHRIIHSIISLAEAFTIESIAQLSPSEMDVDGELGFEERLDLLRTRIASSIEEQVTIKLLSLVSELHAIIFERKHGEKRSFLSASVLANQEALKDDGEGFTSMSADSLLLGNAENDDHSHEHTLFLRFSAFFVAFLRSSSSPFSQLPILSPALSDSEPNLEQESLFTAMDDILVAFALHHAKSHLYSPLSSQSPASHELVLSVASLIHPSRAVRLLTTYLLSLPSVPSDVHTQLNHSRFFPEKTASASWTRSGLLQPSAVIFSPRASFMDTLQLFVSSPDRSILTTSSSYKNWETFYKIVVVAIKNLVGLSLHASKAFVHSQLEHTAFAKEETMEESQTLLIKCGFAVSTPSELVRKKFKGLNAFDMNRVLALEWLVLLLSARSQGDSFVSSLDDLFSPANALIRMLISESLDLDLGSISSTKPPSSSSSESAFEALKWIFDPHSSVFASTPAFFSLSTSLGAHSASLAMQEFSSHEKYLQASLKLITLRNELKEFQVTAYERSKSFNKAYAQSQEEYERKVFFSKITSQWMTIRDHFLHVFPFLSSLSDPHKWLPVTSSDGSDEGENDSKSASVLGSVSEDSPLLVIIPMRFLDVPSAKSLKGQSSVALLEDTAVLFTLAIAAMYTSLHGLMSSKSHGDNDQYNHESANLIKFVDDFIVLFAKVIPSIQGLGDISTLHMRGRELENMRDAIYNDLFQSYPGGL
jgi:Nuclear pore protein 84 / 107